MATERRFSCPPCRIVWAVARDCSGGPPVRCPVCGGEMVPGDLDSATWALPQPGLAGSADDPRVTLAPGGEISALTQPPGLPPCPAECRAAAPLPAAGRYVEQGILGRGGMGEVALCFDPNIRRHVALKRMLPAAREDPAHRLRFVEEAQVTGQLEHPNIVPVHELERAPDGTVYYTMKLIQGRTLSALLQAVKGGTEAPSLVELLQIFLKVCDAIAFAHSRGVVHRDLKPSNIMLGDFGEVLVTDWGLAKILPPEGCPPEGPPPEGSNTFGRERVVSDRQEDAHALTLDGTVVGTPAYMAPEQAEGRVDAVDERTDVYALGAILYELLTLERAVEGATRAETLANVISGNIQRPEQRAPARQIPRELADAAMKSLATRKEHRYPAVADLRREVSHFLEGAEAWIPVCDLDFADGRLDERLDAGYSLDGYPPTAQWVSDPSHVTIAGGLLSIEGPAAAAASRAGFVALHWREPIGEDMRVAVTIANQARNDLRISVSGDTLHGYRFCLDPRRKEMMLETVARGYWEILQERRDIVDWTRPSWEVVVERSGQWVRAWVDGAQAIEYFDPLPPPRGEHHTFGISSRSAGWSIAGIRAWRRRAPELVSVLETGRFLLQNKLFSEAAQFFAEQLATPRSTALDDEARMLYGLALEGLGRTEEAIAAFETAAGSPTRWLAALASTQAARLLIETGNLGAAGRAAWRALELHPEGPTAAVVHRTLVSLVVQPPASSVASLDKEGLRMLAHCMAGDLKLGWKRLDIQDLRPLRDVPLTSIHLEGSAVTDLSPLKGMPLRRLACGWTGVSDLGPLKGAPLTYLACPGTLVADLGPLRGMPLTALHCQQCDRLSNLGPLSGVPLTYLRIERTAVRDLAPLAGMPLTYLNCQDTGVTDVTPLAGMPLEELAFTAKNITKGIEVVRAIKTLKQISGSDQWLPAEEFWRRYDAGEFR